MNKFLMRSHSRFIVGIYSLFSICLLSQNLLAEDGDALWKNEIKPLLEENCWKCHGADKVRAELILTTRKEFLPEERLGRQLIWRTQQQA